MNASLNSHQERSLFRDLKQFGEDAVQRSNMIASLTQFCKLILHRDDKVLRHFGIS